MQHRITTVLLSTFTVAVIAVEIYIPSTFVLFALLDESIWRLGVATGFIFVIASIYYAIRTIRKEPVKLLSLVVIGMILGVSLALCLLPLSSDTLPAPP